MPKSPQNENSNPFFATGRHFLRARMARRSRFFSIQDDSLPVARHTEEPGLGTSLRPGPGLQYPPTGPLPEVARMRNFVQATALRSEASILQESLPDTSRHASRPQHFSAPLRGAPSQAHQCVRAAGECFSVAEQAGGSSQNGLSPGRRRSSASSASAQVAYRCLPARLTRQRATWSSRTSARSRALARNRTLAALGVAARDGKGLWRGAGES